MEAKRVRSAKKLADEKKALAHNKKLSDDAGKEKVAAAHAVATAEGSVVDDDMSSPGPGAHSAGPPPDEDAEPLTDVGDTKKKEER